MTRKLAFVSRAYYEQVAKLAERERVKRQRELERRNQPTVGDKLAVVTVVVKGTLQRRIVTYEQALQQRQRSQGGLAIVGRARTHRWNSETARKAALKSWRVKGRKRCIRGTSERIRLGRAVLRRDPVDYVALRQQYAGPRNAVDGIWYCVPLTHWMRNVPTVHVISERHALKTLGHLKSTRGLVPVKIIKVYPRGRKRAN